MDMELVEDFLEEKYNVIIRLSYNDYSESIKVHEIIVPPESRGQGTGTKVFEYLCKLADKLSVSIVLTPSTDLGGSSISRLKKFYKRFGFVPNKGRNKDYRVMSSMIRYPK
jgi:GNAT superfamily N-acetyltransferase